MTGHSHMPRRAPLPCPLQDFARCPPRTDPVQTAGTWLRFSVFLPALGITTLLLLGLYQLFAKSGISWLEIVLLTLVGLTFVWVTLAVSTAFVGLIRPRASGSLARESTSSLDVALLIPVYNEVPWDVCGNAAAMLRDLDRMCGHHRYTLYLLSDTSAPSIAAQEELVFATLRAEAPAGIPVYYRRRPENIDRKVGNIIDWVAGWGAAHEAMVILDADSLMTANAIDVMADELAADADAGLVQSFPHLIRADTLFARLQQFSTAAYGWLLAEGLAAWSGSEGNYWGHNAILRVRAFAAAARLPHMRGRFGRDTLVLSHDFVEASLLRRSGWRVRFAPQIDGSFEESPATLIDHVVRDRRWCRGNLQHLRLLRTAGLHPVSRFHLFQGAVAYLMSPAWFVLLVFWTLLGRDAETNVIRYFNEANPMFPNWPPEMTHMNSLAFLVIMYAMLLAPKLVAAGAVIYRKGIADLFGGRRDFAAAVGAEICLSIAYAPILMIQQTRAVLGSALGRGSGWAPQVRHARRHRWRDLLAFHWLETCLGLLLAAGLGTGLVSLWLLPICLSLALSVPLSALSACDPGRICWRCLRMENPLTLREPPIVAAARMARDHIRVRSLAAE